MSKEIELRSVNAKVFQHLCRDMFNTPNHNEWLREQRFLVGDADITSRVLIGWTEQGLLDDRREDSQGWRKFSLYELLWIAIIKELRQYGMSLDKIEKGRGIFSDCISHSPSWAYIELAQHLVMLRMPVSLMVYPDGWMEFYFGNECTYLPEPGIKAMLLWTTGRLAESKKRSVSNETQKYVQEFQKCGLKALSVIPSFGNVMMEYPATLIVNFNHICSKILHQDLQPFTRPQISLSLDESKVLDMLRNGTFDEISIVMRDGGIDRISTTAKSPMDTGRILRLIQGIQFGEVTVTKRDGKILFCKQVETKKL